MSITKLIILTFIVYRLSVMIAEDIGPWRVFERIRNHFDEGSEWHDGIRCVGCVAVWIAAGVAVIGSLQAYYTVSESVVIWMATAGGAMFLNRLAPCPK